MNVLLVMPRATQRGGAEQLLDILLQHVPGHGPDLTVVFLEDGPLVQEYRRAGRTVEVIEAGRLRQLSRYIATVVKLKHLIEKRKIDLVFSWMSKAHLYAGIAATWAGLPASWYRHGNPSATSVMDRLITLIPAAKVIACSKHTAAAQEELWPRRETAVVYPCVDTTRFDPERLPPPPEAREILGLPPNGPLIGIVGRLQRWKGIHFFVEAMVQVLEAHPEAHGVIVGGTHDLEPDYPEVVDGLIQKHRVQDRILRVGFQKNVPLWMQAMDIIVHASEKEPFGMVVVEAMALGKPVIAGAEGGPAEIITHETNGLLAPSGKPDALATAIHRFINDAALAQRAAHTAQQRALDFSSAHYAHSFIAQLRRTVGPSLKHSAVSYQNK